MVYVTIDVGKKLSSDINGLIAADDCKTHWF